MNRIAEIEKRLAEIKEIMVREDADIDALNTETDSLIEERKKLLDSEMTRQSVLSKIASGEIGVEKEKENMNMDERKYGVDSLEYREFFLRRLQGRENEVEQRIYASTDSNNAIPTLVADKMFEKMKKLAPMLEHITLFRVAGNLKFVVEGTRNAATKHTQGQAMSDAGDTIVTVTLGGFEFMKVIGISEAALKMSVDAFESFLVNMLAGDIARAIDNYIINDGTNGLVTLSTANEIVQSATTGYGYADITELISKVPAAYDAESVFLLNKATLWNKVKGIVDANKRPIFDATSKTICGYPYVEDDYVSTSNNAIYFGKLSDIVGNLSEDINVKADASAGFTSGTVKFRGLAIFDSKVAKEDGLYRLVSTATV